MQTRTRVVKVYGQKLFSFLVVDGKEYYDLFMVVGGASWFVARQWQCDIAVSAWDNAHDTSQPASKSVHHRHVVSPSPSQRGRYPAVVQG